MANRKFCEGNRVVGREDGPASYRNRLGTIMGFKGKGGYRVKFDDTNIEEYLNSNWLDLSKSVCVSLVSANAEL